MKEIGKIIDFFWDSCVLERVNFIGILLNKRYIGKIYVDVKFMRRIIVVRFYCELRNLIFILFMCLLLFCK